MVVIFASPTEPDRHRAGPRGDAVEMHGAGAALRDAAAVFRAGHADPFANDPEQRRVGIDVNIARLAVDVEFDHGVRSLRTHPGRCVRDDVSMTREATQYSPNATAIKGDLLSLRVPHRPTGADPQTAALLHSHGRLRFARNDSLQPSAPGAIAACAAAAARWRSLNVRAIMLSRAIMRNIRQNLVLRLHLQSCRRSGCRGARRRRCRAADHVVAGGRMDPVERDLLVGPGARRAPHGRAGPPTASMC